jgi:hypothetical protein
LKPLLGPIAPGSASACSHVEGWVMRRFSRFPIALAFAVVGGLVGLMPIAAGHPGAASVAAANYQGLWWHAPAGSESGWGINLAHQGDTIFAAWFTYDATGRQWWLSITANKTAEGIYSGDLIETAGPAFSAVPFDPARVARTVVGTGTFSFHWDGTNGSFTYDVNGVRQTEALTRFVYGALPTCAYAANPDFAAATNYQDVWWVANGAESGWGINLAHQNDIIFASWFTYDTDGVPLWLSMTATKTAPGTYSGDLIRTTGPAYNAIPFRRDQVTRTVVGTASFTFVYGDAATFAYTLNGVQQTKNITRVLFAPPAGTLCRDEVVTPATVTINSPTQSLSVGDYMVVTATARDAMGAVIPGTTATWSVSDSTLANFRAFGDLWAFAPGTVVVSATIGGVTGSQTLTIAPARPPSVTVGQKEVVFRWAIDRCEDQDTPDQPPRAGRAEDGSVVLFAGNAPRYYVSRGADFGSLRRDCSQPALVSANSAAPESYENQEWPWVFYREGSRWHALISNEFHDAVATTCLPGDPSPSNPCWYNSITHAVSTDGAHTFTKPFAPAHVIAPPTYPWTAPLPGDQPSSYYFPQGKFFEGYGGPNSIIRAPDGYYYTSLGATPSKSDPGNFGGCAIRSDRLDDPGSWRGWDGSGFNLKLTSPYVTGGAGPICTALRGTLPNYYNTYLDRYMQVSMGSYTVGGKLICGVFYQLSTEFFHWSQPQLIAETADANCPADAQKPELLEMIPVMSPALIDHADPTVNFERPGRTPYLYYVRFNRGTMSDPLYWLDRDVVRVPLTFTRTDRPTKAR